METEALGDGLLTLAIKGWEASLVVIPPLHRFIERFSIEFQK